MKSRAEASGNFRHLGASFIGLKSSKFSRRLAHFLTYFKVRGHFAAIPIAIMFSEATPRSIALGAALAATGILLRGIINGGDSREIRLYISRPNLLAEYLIVLGICTGGKNFTAAVIALLLMILTGSQSKKTEEDPAYGSYVPSLIPRLWPHLSETDWRKPAAATTTKSSTAREVFSWRKALWADRPSTLNMAIAVVGCFAMFYAIFVVQESQDFRATTLAQAFVMKAICAVIATLLCIRAINKLKK